jgi:Sulfotransferase family
MSCAPFPAHQREEGRSPAPIVVSIIGAGRSGSTLLDIALGIHPEIEGVGELQKLPRSGWVRNDDRRCSCGMPIHECPFWNEVRRRWTEHVGGDGVRRYIELQDRFEHSNRRWARLFVERHRPSPRFRAYAEMTRALYRSVADSSGSTIVLDSSKKPLRSYALVASGALDMRVIHLVRDGRGVVWSRLKPLERNVEAGVPTDQPASAPWRSTLHWAQVNLAGGWVTRRVGPGKGVRVTYESLVADPAGTLARIAPVVGVDLGGCARALLRGDPIAAGHRVGGSRMRMAGSVRLRPDLRWMEDLPPEHARTFWSLAGWLARRYGYTR